MLDIHDLSAQLVRMAKIAKAGYDTIDSNDLRVHLEDLELSYVGGAHNPGTDTQVWVAQERAKDGRLIAYVVFRGTMPRDFKNIRTDIEALPKVMKELGPKIEVHEGFLTAYHRVADTLRKILVTMQPDEIIFIGHSLGAALATLAAADAQLHLVHKEDTIKCITFGCPRSGCESFAKEYDRLNIPSLRVVHGFDIIPNLPKWPFHHVGCKELHVLDTGKVAHSLWSIILKLWARIKDSVDDHMIESYIEALGKMPQ